jgi:hypothetical protein
VVGGLSGFLISNYVDSKRPDAKLKHVATDNGTVDEADLKAHIEAGDVETAYAYKVHQLVNYSLTKQAESPYALTIGKGSVLAAGVTQKIQSGTYSTPEMVFNQNISSSSFVQTANRFYDARQGSVKTYLAKKESDWPSQTPEELTYNDYIRLYGKLIQGEYYITLDESDETMPDRYLTSSKEEYEKSDDPTKALVNGVLIYTIAKSTVATEKGSDGKVKPKESIRKTENGYELSLTLKPSGASYYSFQMKTTGGLSNRTVFTRSVLTFEVDSDFYLVSSQFSDDYSLQAPVIGSTTGHQEMTQYYFHSDSDNFQSTKVTVPSPTETQFNGYDLFPENEK